MAVVSDLSSLDAVATAALVADGELTPLEVVEAAIERIERINPDLNAVITPLFEGAVNAAEGQHNDGPLRGVPFLMKDALCHTKGDPYHFGMQALRDVDWVATHDTWLAERFRSAGLIGCGKTNTPEMAASSVTCPVAYGPTRNPWDRNRTSAGSSGGSAAAVASGMVPVAHGNDMAGSIRIPAAACGVVGLKPTRARISLAPDFGEFTWQMATEFVLTRSVRDAAALLDAVSGSAAGDPYTAAPPKQPFSSAVGLDPGRLLIGYRTDVPGTDERADPRCIEAVEWSARLLESLGHEVVTDSPAALETPINNLVADVFAVCIARELERWSQLLGRKLSGDDVEVATWAQVMRGRTVPATRFMELTEQLHLFARSVTPWWQINDVLITPTMPSPAPMLTADGFVAAADEPAMEFTVPFNVTGQPAISLPLCRTESGLPIGVQLVAGIGREDVLLSLASQLEEAAPWAHHYQARDTPVTSTSPPADREG